MKLLTAFLSIVALAAPATALAAAPTATTGEPRDVTATTATIAGSVDTGGETTTYVAEYRTAASSDFPPVPEPPKTLEAETTSAVVEVALTDLTPSTAYEARLVATNDSGTAEGDWEPFTTAPPPATAPGAVTRSAVEVGPTSARLRGTVDPNRGQTTWYFEYGRTAALGSRTPSRMIPARDGAVAVTETIGDLPQHRRHFFRLVAESPAGTTRGALRRFRTGREPRRVTVKLAPEVVSWATGLTVSGRVRGRGVSRIPIALERQDPLTGAWIEMSTTPTDTKGRYKIAVRSLWALTRMRVITRSRIVAVSPQVWAYVAVRVGIGPRRAKSRGRIRFEGTVFPTLPPEAVASLQKRSPSGRWVRIKRRRVRTEDTGRSRYSVGIRRPKRGGRYRVVVLPRNEGRHVTGRSKVVRLKPQRRMKK